MGNKYYYSDGFGSDFFVTRAEAEQELPLLRDCSPDYADLEFDDVYEEVDIDTLINNEWHIEPNNSDWLSDPEDRMWGDTSEQTKQFMMSNARVSREIQQRKQIQELYDIMTVTEVAKTYKLDVGGVRATIKREALPARKSGTTWLIHRADAEARWGGKK